MHDKVTGLQNHFELLDILLGLRVSIRKVRAKVKNFDGRDGRSRCACCSQIKLTQEVSAGLSNSKTFQSEAWG